MVGRKIPSIHMYGKCRKEVIEMCIEEMRYLYPQGQLYPETIQTVI